MSENTPEFLTVSQAAARLGVSERTITRRCVAGTLAAKRATTESGTAWLIESAAIAAAIKDEVSARETNSNNGDMSVSADNFSGSAAIIQSEEIESIRHDVDQLRVIVTTDIGNRLREALADLPNKADIAEAVSLATAAAIEPLLEKINDEKERDTKQEVAAAIQEVFAPYIAQLDKVALENRKLREELAQERANRPFWQKWWRE